GSSTLFTISGGNGAIIVAGLHSVLPRSSALTLSPSSVTGGSSSTGTATLSAPAPSGGTVVSLSSTNPGVASVPASVTVPAGGTTEPQPGGERPRGATTGVAGWGCNSTDR